MIRSLMALGCLSFLLVPAPALTPGLQTNLDQQAVVTTSEGTFVLSFYPDKVVDGMDVVDKFQKVEVDGETPKQRIELKKVELSIKTP